MYPYNNPTFITKVLNAMKNIKWTSLLDGTQKTLGVVNQAIPVFYQIKPIVQNAKAIWKVANTKESNQTIEKKEPIENNSPIFYL